MEPEFNNTDFYILPQNNGVFRIISNPINLEELSIVLIARDQKTYHIPKMYANGSVSAPARILREPESGKYLLILPNSIFDNTSTFGSRYDAHTLFSRIVFEGDPVYQVSYNMYTNGRIKRIMSIPTGGFRHMYHKVQRKTRRARKHRRRSTRRKH
jgi:hypothetical protein